MKEDSALTSPRARFSAAASTYEDHAGPQREAAERLARLLSPLEPPGRILEVGCGTGVFTRLLVKGWPSASVDALDVAPGMIEEARRGAGLREGLRWIVCDARAFEDPDGYDWIVSNCSLHWLEPFEESVRHLAGMILPRGILAASVVLDGTLRELHELRRQVAPQKAPGGKLPTEDSIRRAVELCGAHLEVFEVEEAVTAVPSVDRLLEDLRRQGVTGGSISRGPLPLNRREIRAVVEEYAARHSVPGGVRMTYRTAFFRARMSPLSRIHARAG